MANFVALSSGATYTAQQPAGWNKPCTESHLASISEKIADWRAVSPHLGLTEAEEREILESIPHSVSAQKIAMLRKWKEKQGGKGTYRRLCRVFETECKRADLVYLVKQLLAETSSSSDEEVRDEHDDSRNGRPAIIDAHQDQLHAATGSSNEEQARKRPDNGATRPARCQQKCLELTKEKEKLEKELQGLSFIKNLLSGGNIPLTLALISDGTKLSEGNILTQAILNHGNNNRAIELLLRHSANISTADGHGGDPSPEKKLLQLVDETWRLKKKLEHEKEVIQEQQKELEHEKEVIQEQRKELEHEKEVIQEQQKELEHEKEVVQEQQKELEHEKEVIQEQQKKIEELTRMLSQQQPQ